MRTLLAAALLLVSALAAAQDAPKPLSIVVESLGDDDRGVVTRVFFRFANPNRITDAGLFLEGSYSQEGRVPRNFRFAVPRKDDKLVWNNTFVRNGKTIRRTRWAVLPDQRNEMSAIHAFAVGEAEIEVRLILEGDRGAAPVVVAQATETVTVSKTNRPYVDEADEIVADESVPAPAPAPDEAGPVAVRASRRDRATNLFVVDADVRPPVKRVEFWIDEKKVLARNAPPYKAELDLGGSPEGTALRAIGFDGAGRYVDADAIIVEGPEVALTVELTRTDTRDGLSHFKLSVRNPKGTPLKSITLYAGDKQLHAWDRPPYTLSVSTASLAGVKVVTAVVIDETGLEASDRSEVR